MTAITFDVQTTIAKILGDTHWRSINGAIYDRDGDYLGPIGNGHAEGLADDRLAVLVHQAMSPDEIRDAVIGLHGMSGHITTRQAAKLCGKTPEAFRAMVSDAARRHRVDLQVAPQLWPDRRTPLYDLAKLNEYLSR